MKESLVNVQRAIVAHDQSAKVAAPSERALHSPVSFMAAQRPPIMRSGLAPILAMGGNQLDAALRQLLPQRVAVAAPVSDKA